MLKLNSSQITAWLRCRELWRLSQLQMLDLVKPAIHLEFGKAVHKVIEGYWLGKPFFPAFQEGFAIIQAVDQRLLDSTERAKWTSLVDSFQKTCQLYYERHGQDCEVTNLVMLEGKVEWPWSDEIMHYGTIDRVAGTTLTDVKTAAAVGREWRTEFKRHHLREPQLWYYLRYCRWAGIPIDRIEYEVVVKSYRGSDPDLEVIDVTDEVLAREVLMNQQIDWAIREIATFVNECADVAPWPMNSGVGCFTKYGACNFEPVCSGRVAMADGRLYKIREETADAIK